MDKLLIGSIEMCHLPSFGVSDLQTRIDTGAQTSSLHVDKIEKFKKGGKPWVRFDLHPDFYNLDEVVACESPLHDVRKIKSSNGQSEQRHVIKTILGMGGQEWPIEITLTDRSEMSYLMLLGRQGMADKVIIDPSQTYITGSES